MPRPHTSPSQRWAQPKQDTAHPAPSQQSATPMADAFHLLTRRHTLMNNQTNTAQTLDQAQSDATIKPTADAQYSATILDLEKQLAALRAARKARAKAGKQPMSMIGKIAISTAATGALAVTTFLIYKVMYKAAEVVAETIA